MNRTTDRTEAKLQTLFAQAMCAIAFYEAQRDGALRGLENLRLGA
jgi:hypothetical protein